MPPMPGEVPVGDPGRGGGAVEEGEEDALDPVDDAVWDVVVEGAHGGRGG